MAGELGNIGKLVRWRAKLFHQADLDDMLTAQLFTNR